MLTPSPDRPTGRVLLAEDNSIVQKVVLVLLDRLGYEADPVGNGHEVLSALDQHAYRVILMDIQMPTMGGLEATRRIREQIAPPDQPYIVALTANTGAEDRRRCLDAGMDAFLGKPVDKSALADILEERMPAV